MPINDSGNIILYQVDPCLSIRERSIESPNGLGFLTFDGSTLEWTQLVSDSLTVRYDNGAIKIDASIDSRVIMNDKLRGTNIFYLDERIGVGRAPLHSYKIDVAVEENKLTTAFHIGDGKFGFSMGNGTNSGFIPEIIGMGADEYDAGLYFIGRAGNNIASPIPLIIIDARNHLNKKVTNRPILGITNAKYDSYEFIIDQNGLVGIGKIPKNNKLEIQGNVQAYDFILDSSISITTMIKAFIEQNKQIDILKDRITYLEKIMKNDKN